MGVAEQLRALAGEIESSAQHLGRVRSTVERMVEAGVKLEKEQASLVSVVKWLEDTAGEWALLADQLDHRH